MVKNHTISLLLLLPAACVSTTCPPTGKTSQAIDLGTTWTLHVIKDGTASGSPSYKGADGTSIAVEGSDLLVSTGWEQSSRVTVSRLSGGTWTTADVGGNASVEDVQLGDIDKQGAVDAVSFSQNKDIKVHFGETGPADLTITNAHNDQIWQCGALFDLDGDGDLDIIAGGRRAAYPAAYVKWYENPGGLNARSNGSPAGTYWVEHQIDVTGWTMNIVVQDVDGDGDPDIVQSDRDTYWTGVGTSSAALKGIRWYENDGSQNFTNHMVSTPVPYIGYGESKMFSLFDIDRDGDLDVIAGSSVLGTNPQNHLYVYTNDGDFKSWTKSEVTLPSGIGQYHDGEAADIDNDGNLDIVLTFSDAYDAGLSGVVWLQSDGAGGYSRGEVSGDYGDKYDNAVLHDMDGDGDFDILTSEQHEDTDNTGDTVPGIGLIWYENPLL